MDILRIADMADALVCQCKTRDPYSIIKYLNITLLPEPLTNLKGCFLVRKRNSYIIINQFLDENEAVWVLGHEIGHRILHYLTAQNLSRGLHEFSLFDMTTTPEREANLFAAELLVDEEELTDYIYNYGYNVAECAKAMSLHPAVIALKIEILIARGHDLKMQDYDRNFLKKKLNSFDI